MKLEYSRQIFEKHSNIKFHENPYKGSRIAPCGCTDEQTDMTKLTLAFRSFEHAPKNWSKLYLQCSMHNSQCCNPVFQIDWYQQPYLP